MRIRIYYDIENFGLGCDIEYIYEQILIKIGASHEIEQFAYYDWENKAPLENQTPFNNLAINCVSVRTNISGVLLKNTADIRIAMDITKDILGNKMDAIVLCSGDKDFLPVVEMCVDNNILIWVAGSKCNCSLQIQKNVPNLIMLKSKREKGQSILKKEIESHGKPKFQNYYELINRILFSIESNNHLYFTVKTKGIPLSELIALIKEYIPEFNVKCTGYESATELMRAATYNSRFVVARNDLTSNPSVIRLFFNLNFL